MTKTLVTALAATLTLLSFPLASKAQVSFPNHGGTGTSSAPAVGDVLVGCKNAANQFVYCPRATSTLGITGSGGSSFDFTPQTFGVSTTSVTAFFNGLISAASTTISYLGNGLTASNNGRLYGGNATSTLSGTGIVDISNAPAILGSSPAVASIIGGTNGQVLAWLNGVATWAASSSVAAGTGISVSTNGAVTTVTNASPDQTVTLSNGTGISVSGTYPTFTITNTAPLTFSYPFPSNATTSALSFTNGLISAASTTLSYLTSGLVGNNNGRLYSFASSSLFGFTPASNATTITTTYPLQGGGDLTANRTISLAFGTTTQNLWSAYNSVASLFATNASTTNATTTGTSYFTGISASKILRTDANNKLDAVTVGSGLSFDGTTLSATGIASNALGTSSPWTQGQIAYVVSNSAVSSAATGTLSGTANQISISNSPSIIGASSVVSLPSLVNLPLAFTAAYGTTTYASSTALSAGNANFTVSSSTYASSTALTTNAVYINGLTSGSLYVGADKKQQSTATSSFAITGPFSVPSTFGALVGGSGSITYTGLATTSAITQGQVLYGTSASGVASAATSSLSGSGIVTVSNAPAILGASSASITITGGSNGQVLGWLGGVPTWTASTSLSAGAGISVSPAGSVTTVTNTSPLSGLTASFPLSFSNPALSWIGLATSSNISAGQAVYATGPNSIAGTATTTLVAGTNVSFSGGTPVIFGASPVTINATGGSSSGLATSSPVSGGNLLAYSATGAGSAIGVATSSLSISGPFTVPSASIIGASGAITYTGLATTTQPASSNVLTSNGASGVYGTATSTLTPSSPLTGSFIQLGSSGSIGIQTASAAQAGAISAADWATFNNKVSSTSLSATFPLSYNSSTGAFAFGGLSTSTSAVQGNIPYFSGVNTFANVGTSTRTYVGPFSVSGTLGYQVGGSNSTITYYGLATTSAISQGQVLYGTSASGVASVATSSFAVSSSFSYSGTLGSLVGGANGTLSIANGGVSNAMLANSTISGVALGGTLNSHSHDATLSGTSYNGSAAVSDWGLNLGNANTWTALQQFSRASSTLLSTNGPFYVGTTSTTTIWGNATSTFSGGIKATTGGLSVSTLTSCDTIDTDANGNFLCGTDATGAGGAFPFTPTTNYGVTANATTTALWAQAGLFASSTSAYPTLSVSNAGAGPAAIFASGAVGIATSTPTARFAVEQGSAFNYSFLVGNEGSSSPAFAVLGTNGNGRVGVGSSSPWGQFSIANPSLTNYDEPSFVVSTSSDTFGELFKIFATSTNQSTLTNPFGTLPQPSGARIVMGSGTYYGDLYDSVVLTILGWWNQRDSQTFCDNPVALSAGLSADGFNGCPYFVFAEDNTGTLQPGATSGAQYGILQTTAANDGAGVFAGGTGVAGWLSNIGSSTPMLEADARIGSVQNATSSHAFYIGFFDTDINGTAFEVAPTAGCYFTASSTRANWQAVARSSAANITQVDTGIASSTVITGTGNFRRFKVITGSNGCVFRMRPDGSSNYRTVAAITNNLPTAAALNAGVYLSDTLTGAGASFEVKRIRLWWRDVLP